MQDIPCFLCLPFQFSNLKNLLKYYFSAFFISSSFGCCFVLLIFLQFFKFFFDISGLLEFIKLCARKIILPSLFFFCYNIYFYVQCILFFYFYIWPSDRIKTYTYFLLKFIWYFFNDISSRFSLSFITL